MLDRLVLVRLPDPIAAVGRSARTGWSSLAGPRRPVQLPVAHECVERRRRRAASSPSLPAVLTRAAATASATSVS